MTTTNQHELDTKPHPHVIHFTLDNEKEETTDATLTVAQVLDLGDLDPTTHYLVELQGHHQVEHKDVTEVLKIHEGEHFISVYRGDTPVS